MSMSASSSTNTSSGSTPANSDGGADATGGSTLIAALRRPACRRSPSGLAKTAGGLTHPALQLVVPADVVERGALGRRAAGAMGGGDQILRLEHDPVVA